MQRLIILSLLHLSVVQAADISGKATVLDGDSLRVGDVEVHLNGIDAPELAQLCSFRGDDWVCGETAKEALGEIVQNAKISCSWTEQNETGVALATCTREGHDIAEIMINYGLAVADIEYTGRYLPDEAAAKAARTGLWSTHFVKPGDWRRGVRLPGNELPAARCRVRGKTNEQGVKTYAVVSSTAAGDPSGAVCFESVIEAELAGFKPAPS